MNALEEISRYVTDDHVIGLAWAPDSSRYAVLSASGALTLPSLTGDTNHTVSAQPVGGLALSWGKSGILTGGQEGTVSCWQPDSDGSLAKRFEIDPGENWVDHIVWSRDATRFVTAAGKKLRLWSDTGELIQAYPNQPSTIAALSLRPDNQAVGIGIYGGVRLYRFSESMPVRRSGVEGFDHRNALESEWPFRRGVVSRANHQFLETPISSWRATRDERLSVKSARTGLG